MVDVNTIGAGGGSIAWVDAADSLRVGPQSAGARAGPCLLPPRRRRSDCHRCQPRARLSQSRRRSPAASRSMLGRRQGGDQARRRQRIGLEPHRHRGRHSSHRQRAHERRGAPRLGTARLRPTPIRAAAVGRRRPGARLRAAQDLEHRQSRSFPIRRACSQPSVCWSPTSSTIRWKPLRGERIWSTHRCSKTCLSGWTALASARWQHDGVLLDQVAIRAVRPTCAMSDSPTN